MTENPNRGREVRAVVARHDPFVSKLRGQELEDFLDGRCQVRHFEGTVILDYTRPWSF